MGCAGVNWKLCVAAGLVDFALYPVTLMLQATAVSASLCRSAVLQPYQKELRPKLLTFELGYTMERELAPESKPTPYWGLECGITPLRLSLAMPGSPTPKSAKETP